MDMQATVARLGFPDERVYGTQVPALTHLEYQAEPADGGKVKLHMTVTQSEVEEALCHGRSGSSLTSAAAWFASAKSVSPELPQHPFVLPPNPKKVALNAYKEIWNRLIPGAQDHEPNPWVRLYPSLGRRSASQRCDLEASMGDPRFWGDLRKKKRPTVFRTGRAAL